MCQNVYLEQFLMYAMVEADGAFTPMRTATFRWQLAWISSTVVLKPWFKARRYSVQAANEAPWVASASLEAAAHVQKVQIDDRQALSVGHISLRAAAC